MKSICGIKINPNRKEGNPVLQNCIEEYDHERGFQHKEHTFEDPKITQEKISLMKTMLKELNPMTPEKLTFTDHVLSNWSDETKLAFACIVLTSSKLSWNMEKRWEYLKQFSNGIYFYKLEDTYERVLNSVNLLIEEAIKNES
jgi:hypothetical protein